MSTQHVLSDKGVAHEMGFWHKFVRSDRFLNNWVSRVPNPELNGDVRRLFEAMLTPELRVLDVGSGPVSILHGVIPAAQLTTVDPLGTEYRKIFDFALHGIEPPVPLAAEDLPYEGEFDVVHMSNALDHTVNPILVFEKLLTAARPGGFVIVQGFVNEGSFENWSGFHQWDISINKLGHLFIANRLGGGVAFSKNKISGNYYELETGKTWMVWLSQR